MKNSRLQIYQMTLLFLFGVKVNCLSRVSLITEVVFCSNYLFFKQILAYLHNIDLDLYYRSGQMYIFIRSTSRIYFALKNLIDADMYVLKKLFL